MFLTEYWIKRAVEHNRLSVFVLYSFSSYCKFTLARERDMSGGCSSASHCEVPWTTRRQSRDDDVARRGRSRFVPAQSLHRAREP